MKAKQTFC